MTFAQGDDLDWEFAFFAPWASDRYIREDKNGNNEKEKSPRLGSPASRCCRNRCWGQPDIRRCSGGPRCRIGAQLCDVHQGSPLVGRLLQACGIRSAAMESTSVRSEEHTSELQSL